MALQVWLPLNGDLHNQGLSNVTVTNNGATVDSNGKIGKCYNFDGSNDFISFSNFNPSEYEEFSLSLWYKANVANNSIFLIRKNDTTHQICLGFNQFSFRDKLNSSLRLISFSGMTTDVWQHISIVYDKGSIYIYLNGTLQGSYISQSNTSLNSNLNEIRLGRVKASSYDNFFNGYINDLRIYDHALSQKEVHEIAKGLILHYKLNDTQYNSLLPYGVELYDYIQSSGTQWIDTGVYGYMNHTYEIEFQQNDTGNYRLWGVFGQSSYVGYNMSLTYPNMVRWESTSNAQRSVSLETIGVNKHILTITDGLVNFDGVDKGISKGHNSNTVINYNLFLFTTNPANTTPSSNAKVKIYSYKDIDVDGNIIRNMIPCIYLGEPGMWDTVENKFYRNQGTGQFILGNEIINTEIYDSSGYCNDGTIIGTTTLNLSSPRYNKCLSMNNTGTANHIEANPIGVSDNIFTVSFWVNAQKSTNQVFVADPKIVIGTLNSLLYVVTTSSAPFTTTNFITGWNHIVVIRNGTTYKAYINGIAETRSGSNNYYAHLAAKLWLLNRSYNTTYAANASISDFRIYATVLSEDDIKELYNTSAVVDNNQNIECFQLEESIEDIVNIMKTGVITCNSITEDNLASIYDNGDITCNQLIEI